MIDLNRNLAVRPRAGRFHTPLLLPALVAALERQSLLLFGWLLLATPVAVQAQFSYTVENGNVTITGYLGTNSVVVIPDTITGLPVTAIGGYPLFDESPSPWPSLTSVTIPNSVTSIGGGAFVGSSSLTNIMVDPLNSAYSSADGVLFNQSQTTLVEYPGGKFGHYTIPNSVTRIGTLAFVDCYGLTSVTIPNSVTDIGDSAFSGCDSLTNVTIGNALTSIGYSAFSRSSYHGCPLMDVTIPNSVTNIGAFAFAACTKLTNVTLGDGVISIGDGAFYGCSLFLTSVTIPTSVTSIGDIAFAYTSLGSVTIPKSVTSIGSDAFISCRNLSAISVETNNPAYSSVGGVLFDESQTTLIEYPGGNIGSYSIPNSVISIGDGAFYGCLFLTSVTIPNNVTSIGPWAFQYTGLTNVSIGNSVTNIGSGFYDCTSLTAISVETNNPAYTSVGGVLFNQSQTTLIEYPRGKVGSYSIPNGVTNIGPGAFIGCLSLTGVTIPSSVTSIGDGAFFACMGLRNVFFEANPPAVGGQYVFGALIMWEGRLVGPDPATAYFLPGSTGWSTNYGGIPTAFWTLSHPLILNNTPGFGVQSNGFSYTVSWATNLSVVVEATSDLANPVWSPLATNALSGGTFYFSDSQWTNYPSRFYRVRSQ